MDQIVRQAVEANIHWCPKLNVDEILENKWHFPVKKDNELVGCFLFFLGSVEGEAIMPVYYFIEGHGGKEGVKNGLSHIPKFAYYLESLGFTHLTMWTDEEYIRLFENRNLPQTSEDVLPGLFSYPLDRWKLVDWTIESESTEEEQNEV